jgi:hypothetical protein
VVAPAAPLQRAFDRSVLERGFSLGRRLPPYSRAELRASVAALRARAFADGYGSGAALLRESNAQQSEEMQARLEVAQAQVRRGYPQWVATSWMFCRLASSILECPMPQTQAYHQKFEQCMR